MWNFNPENDAIPLAFRRERMQDQMHAVGNRGLDDEGNLNPDGYVKGKRWEAWYDQYDDKTAYIKDGLLYLAPHVDKVKDLTRRELPASAHCLYAPFLTTWTRRWIDGGHVSQPVGNGVFGPPEAGEEIVFEMNVSFERMFVPAIRCSWWLMPVDLGEIPNRAYDDDPRNGIEVDIFEYDPAQPHLLLCKAVGGAAGDTADALVTANVDKGFHVIRLRWSLDALVWEIDGREVVRDAVRVPSVPMYMILSMEANSGVKPVWDVKEGDRVEDPPYLPASSGLYGKNCWSGPLNRYHENVARIDYISVETVSTSKGSILDCIKRCLDGK